MPRRLNDRPDERSGGPTIREGSREETWSGSKSVLTVGRDVSRSGRVVPPASSLQWEGIGGKDFTIGWGKCGEI